LFGALVGALEVAADVAFFFFFFCFLLFGLYLWLWPSCLVGWYLWAVWSLLPRCVEASAGSAAPPARRMMLAVSAVARRRLTLDMGQL